MLGITLYIIPSGLKNADLDKTINSFTYYNEDIDEEITLIKDVVRASSIRDIMMRRNGNEDDWFIVVYDNEHITIGLAYAFMNFMRGNADVLVVMKNVDEYITQSPRAFKNFVRLGQESLLPDKDAMSPVTKKPLVYVRILDGWIREHV